MTTQYGADLRYFEYASRGSYYLSVEAKAPKARGHQSHEAPSLDPILL